MLVAEAYLFSWHKPLVLNCSLFRQLANLFPENVSSFPHLLLYLDLSVFYLHMISYSDPRFICLSNSKSTGGFLIWRLVTRWWLNWSFPCGCVGLGTWNWLLSFNLKAVCQLKEGTAAFIFSWQQKFNSQLPFTLKPNVNVLV